MWNRKLAIRLSLRGNRTPLHTRPKGEVEPRTSRSPVQSGASGECIGVKAFPVAIFDEAKVSLRSSLLVHISLLGVDLDAYFLFGGEPGIIYCWGGMGGYPGREGH